ncbi:MAG: RDD family protein [Burkholderiales bacterium]|nr:RDD family protein [Burkholderiales bacterium]
MNEPTAAAAGAAPMAPLDSAPAAAPLLRRMAAFLYEGVLLFGVTFATGLVFAVAMHQNNAMKLRSALIAVEFVVVGLYFIVLWVRSGQTLPMKTWHLRLVNNDGAAVSPRRALVRYLASYAWFLPPLALAGALRLPSAWAIFGLVAGWIVLYALAALLHPRRQFWHDALCGTAIVTARPLAPLPQ